jgi:SAM-dependent methyltransferase
MPTDLYAAPGVYDLLFDDRVDDVRFYAGLARGSLRVLEYGAGTGRITLPVAREGASVVAVEREPAMLDGLRERLAAEPAHVAARVTPLAADATDLSLDARFDRVLFPFNGLAHLHTAAQQSAFFARVREHLAPDGLFAFDLWIPEPRLLLGDVLESGRFLDPRTREPVTLREEFAYDALSQVLSTELTLTPVLDPSAARRWTISQRQFFPEETRALLAANGLDLRWRTTRWKLPTDLSQRHLDDETPDERGAMIAYVCALRPPSTG